MGNGLRFGGAVTRLAPVAVASALLCPGESLGQGSDPPPSEPALPRYLQDRGAQVPVSIFGTYILPGEVIVYPFFEYYRDSNAEYSPQELGYGLDQDFRGDYEAYEYLLQVAYGVSDRFSIEVEAAVISAELEKSADDPTLVPQELTESGLGDVQTQVNWLWQEETARSPALISFAEVVFPFQKDGSLIGTSDWEVVFGAGVIRGFPWGTATLRAAVEYDGAEGAFAVGEAAVEYLKRLSSTWKIFAAVEGSEDEWELITEAQLHISRSVCIKLNSAVGITSKAAGWAPETGVVFRF